MRYWAEADALARTLQRIANGVDNRIHVAVERQRGEWGFRMTDPWGGDWFEENWRKVREFFWTGY